MSARRRPAATPDVDALLAALADPARRRAVEILGRGPLRAGELAERLGLAAPAMSRHLKALKAAGLVAETHPEFDARVRVYALNTQRLSGLKDWLARAEQGWSEQLSAFAAFVAERQEQKGVAERQDKKPARKKAT
jgi:DNA-binding transcriptional ArsR family regulator